MAAERAMGPLVDVVKEAVLATLREELAAHKEEVNELRHMLTAVGKRNEATAVVEERDRQFAGVKGELEAVKGELEAVKGELEAVKGELEAVKGKLEVVKGVLAEYKDAMTQKMTESNRASDVAGLRGKSKKRRQEMTTECAREEEGRREVQELNQRAMEELAACEERQMIQDLKLNVELEISQSKGDREAAWQVKAGRSSLQVRGCLASWFVLSPWSSVPVSCFPHPTHSIQAIKSASQRSCVNLQNFRGLSDAMLGHVSTMTHLTSIDLTSSSGFSAEGIKHLYRLPRLYELNLNDTDISDSALKGIGSLTNLTDLHLLGTKVADAGLPRLKSLPSLRFLVLRECNGVTDAGMVHVGRLTELELLVLDDTTLTDDGLQQLTALTKLRCLYTRDRGFLCFT